MNKNKFYRADIDGLRAIAIMSVVIFHMAPEYFPGGYAGVDVFFVISGYLITSIILKELEKGSFSFTDFYMKRVLRLFPALLIVLSVTLAFGWLILLPPEFKQLGKHTAYGAGFLANIVLFKEVNYFDTASEFKQLLHLWSLGIEEQFYFFWPVSLFVIWKLKPKLVPWFALACIAYSFGININKVPANLEYAFFMPHTRFWELILGGLIGWFEVKNLKVQNTTVQDFLSTTGLLVCFLSFFLLEGNSQFPGYWALLPVIGTAMIIIAPNAWLNRIMFSNPIAVFIGLISYPLYLWHWPLLSYSYVMHNRPAPLFIRIGLVLFSGLLAVITYLYVEKKFKKIPNNKKYFASYLLVAGVALVGLIGFLGNKKIVTPYSSRPDLEKISDALSDWDFPGRLKKIEKDGNKLWYQGDAPKKIILIGDSNIQQYYPRLEKLQQESKDSFSFYFATGGGCPPFPSVKHDSKYNFCSKWIENGYKLAASSEIKNVVIGAQWTKYVSTNSQFYIQKNDRKILINDNSEGYKLALSALKEKILELRKLNKNVYFIMNIPVGPDFAPLNSIKRSISLQPVKVEAKVVTRAEFESKHMNYFKDLKQLALEAGAIVIDPLDHLCSGPSGQCLVIAKDGRPIYKDNSHIRPFYIREYTHYFDKALTGVSTL